MSGFEGIDSKIVLVGLTGSIGTGKSTASAFFKELGVPVVDADEIAHRVTSKGTPAYKRIVAAFGEGMLTGDGALDRKKLAEKIFGDEEARRTLEGIVHPEIAGEAAREVEKKLKESDRGFVVCDVPLLFEKNLTDRYDLIVTVYAPREASLSRASARSGVSPEEIEARLNAQIDAAAKAALSHVTLDNTGGKEALRLQVSRLVDKISLHNEVKKVDKVRRRVL